MWKWTTDIKVVIIDVDFLDEEFLNYNNEYNLNDVDVVYVSKYLKHMENADNFKNYFNEQALLAELITPDIDSSNIISISSNANFLLEMSKNHIGTIFADKNGISFSIRQIFIADFITRNYRGITDAISGLNAGYYGEAISSSISAKKIHSLIKFNNQKNNLELYIMGRYYPRRNDEYYENSNDPFSTLILYFKNKNIPIISEMYSNVINFIARNEKLDIVTFVPKKPNEDRSRFESLNLKIGDIDYSNLFTCIKYYKQKGQDLNTRISNVKGSFVLNDGVDVNGKNVLIIDDIYTTGATLDELTDVLIKSGAKKIFAVVLAADVNVSAVFHRFKPLKCCKCGNKMILKLSGTNKLFFAHEDYLNSCKYTMNVDNGVIELRKLNIIEFSEEDDLYDEY